MDDGVSLDGRVLAGVANAEAGKVDADTRFEFEQDGDRLSAGYAGGAVEVGHLLGTFDGRECDVRYVQRNEAGETATGHSVGVATRLEDGRVRIEDAWEWESKPGRGESVLEEVRD